MRLLLYPFVMLGSLILLVSIASLDLAYARDFNMPSKKGGLKLYFLTKSGGNIQLSPCTKDNGSGLFGIAHIIETDRKNSPEALCFITGDLFDFKKYRNDLFMSVQTEKHVKYVKELYKIIKPTAVLPGVNDLAIGVDELKKRLEECGVSAVCSNCILKENKQPLFKPFLISESNGFKIGVIGLLSDNMMEVNEKDKDDNKSRQNLIPTNEYINDESIFFKPPASVIKKYCALLRKEGVDLIIALSDLSLKRTKEVLKNTDIDVIIGNNLCKNNGYKYRVGGVKANTVNSSKKLGIMEFNFCGDPLDPLGDLSRVQVAESNLSEIKQKLNKIINKYGTDDINKIEKLSLNDRDISDFKEFSLKIDELALGIDQAKKACTGNYLKNTFVDSTHLFSLDVKSDTYNLFMNYNGEFENQVNDKLQSKEKLLQKIKDQAKAVVDNKLCAACHKEQYDHWKSSKHASAYQPILDNKCEYMPACVRCHSTGFGCENGFITLPVRKGMDSINCEVCHGFLGEHLKDPLTKPSSDINDNISKTKKLCSFCHDETHSPNFDFKTAYPQIACPKIDYSTTGILNHFKIKEQELTSILDANGELKNADLYVRLAIYRSQLNYDDDNIIDILYKGLKLNPNNKDIVLFLHNKLISNNRKNEALAVFEKFILSNTQDSDMNKRIVRLLVLDNDLEDLDKAMKYIEYYIETINKKDVEIYLLLCSAYIKLGLYDDARTILDQLNDLKPNELNKSRIKILDTQLKKVGK